MWDDAIDINQVREIRTRTTVFFGVCAINKIDVVLEKLKSQNISKILIITGARSYKVSGAWEIVEKALKQNGIDYVLSSNAEPNPTTKQVDVSVKLGINFGAQAVLAIGGGSVIDSAKAAAVLLNYPDKNCRQLYEKEFTPEIAAPIIAINLTHGTGTESNRNSVITVPETGNKMAVGFDFTYPLFSIDDPALMTKLPKEQILYVSIDALNHAFESATTNVTNPLAVSLSKETIRLVAKYLPKVLENPEDLYARYMLAYAAMSVGIAFDCTGLHITHSIGKFINNIKPDFPHGLSLTILLPSVIKHVYPQKSLIITDILSPIIPELKGNPDEGDKAAYAMEKWLFKLGLDKKLSDTGITESDIDRLVDICMNAPILPWLKNVTPMEITAKSVRGIYMESMKPL